MGVSVPTASASLRSSSGLSQSIQKPSRMDCSVCRAANFSTRCLQALTKLSMPCSRMAFLVVKPSSFSTSTSTHKPLAVEPVLIAEFVPGHREEALVGIFERPAPGVVHAHRVVGGNRAIQKTPLGLARVFLRSFWKMSAAVQNLRTWCSPRIKSASATFSNMISWRSVVFFRLR